MLTGMTRAPPPSRIRARDPVPLRRPSHFLMHTGSLGATEATATQVGHPRRGYLVCSLIVKHIQVKIKGPSINLGWPASSPLIPSSWFLISNGTSTLGMVLVLWAPNPPSIVSVPARWPRRVVTAPRLPVAAKWHCAHSEKKAAWVSGP